LGEAPKYADFPDPVAQNDNQVLINVTAASVKNLDKGRASGAHYASYKHLPALVGIDAVGTLPDGRRVYGSSTTGTIAEKALIDSHTYTVLPDHIDDVTAAALPNAVMGAALALHYRAGMKAGDTVLINGATGVTGQAAIQIARHYGAKKIIATGRNPETLKMLPDLGADELVSLQQEDQFIIQQLKEIHANSPVDIVIDYTWGHPAELLLEVLKGGGLHVGTHKVRFVTVGGMAGDKIQLSSAVLRSSAIEVLGSGIGSLPQEAMDKLYAEVLPEMFELAASGKLKIDTVTRSLEHVEVAWFEDIPSGKRLVITI
jgi:NADPH:quinone reductase-like Zn-dependent oxidoreductase